MAVLDVGSDEFQSEVLEHEGETVFVDFWAPWCGPCKAVAPLFNTLSGEVEAKFVKVNIENNQEIAAQFNIRSIPTFLAIRDGEVVDTMIGSQGVDSFIDDNL